MTLETLTDELPDEARQWLFGMNDSFRRATLHLLEIVGPDAFIRHWKTHRDYQQKLEHDFAE